MLFTYVSPLGDTDARWPVGKIWKTSLRKWHRISRQARWSRPSADGQGKETEHNWLPREKSLIRIRGLLRGQAHVKHLDSFLAGMKMGIAEGISKTVSGYMGQD